MLDDAEILVYFRNPDTKQMAFTQLMNKYQQRIYSHIRQMIHHETDADDIIQEVWIKVWKNLDQFKGNSQLYTWLYRITMNEVFNYMHHKKRNPAADAEAIDLNITWTTEITTFDPNQLEKKLAKAIASLPARQKEIFHLRYFHQMSYETISGLTGISIGALKASFHHAVKKIEKILNED